MISVGIDLIEIDRVQKSVQRESFLNRVYSENERLEFAQTGNAPASIAAAFAAKEAFAKSIGTGIRGFSLCEVQLLHDELGCPHIHLTGRAREIAQKGKLKFTVSISHTKTHAAATVIAFTGNY